VRSIDPSDWLTPADTLHMATHNGAAALGLPAKLGRIAPGYEADLVMLDLSSINYLPLNHAIRQVVFAEEGRAVDKVMVGGRMVVRDGRPLLVDYARLRAEVTARSAALLEANASRRGQLAALEPHVQAFCRGLAATPHPVEAHLH